MIRRGASFALATAAALAAGFLIFIKMPRSAPREAGPAAGETVTLPAESFQTAPAPARDAAGAPATEVDLLQQKIARGKTARERIAAIETLTKFIPGDGEPIVIEAAGADPDAEVRQAALEALAASSTDATIEAYCRALADAEPWVRDAGEVGLYRFADRERAAAACARILRSPDRDLRVRAADLLDELEAGPIPWDLVEAGPLDWAPPGAPKKAAASIPNK